MNSNAKLSVAIAAILSGAPAGFASAGPASDTETSSTDDDHGNHRHRAAALREHARRADLDSGVHRAKR